MRGIQWTAASATSFTIDEAALEAVETGAGRLAPVRVRKGRLVATGGNGAWDIEFRPLTKSLTLGGADITSAVVKVVSADTDTTVAWVYDYEEHGPIDQVVVTCAGGAATPTFTWEAPAPAKQA